ncbi:glycoside hydrolase family 31 protein [soil metagenome]
MIKSTAKLILLIAVLPLSILHAFSQKVFSDSSGIWKVVSYPSNILKVSFQPYKYLQNEQVSNAVIAKPILNVTALQMVRKEATNQLEFQFIRFKKHVSYFDSTAFKGFRINLTEDEKIFGTGERSVPLDRRGFKLNLYNNPRYGYGNNADNLNYSVPVIISSAGYGIFFDNPSKGYLDIGKSEKNILRYGASSGELTFYIIPGKNVDEILRAYHSLTGTQPIPARWVFGNLMSRFGYRSEAQLTGIVNKMRDERFPVDAVILDLFWFGDSIQNTLGTLEWVNKKAWPDPEKMIRNLKNRGINTVLITEPFIINSTPNYEPSKKFHATDSAGKPFLLTDFYFGHGGLLDIFRKDAQQWFWTKYKTQIKKGVAGWWGDLGEPERHPSTIFHNLKDLGFKRKFKADEVHNIYGHYWDKMLFDKYSKEYPAVRLFNLNRSGYAGSSRYGVFPWSGDVSRSWEGLQAQLPLMLGMSMSGVPYIHADAGGFAGGDGDQELYTRWLQFAVFTPVLRPHGTALGDLVPNVNDIPSEGALYEDPYKSIVRNYIRLRYRLLPYNYTLAYEQAKFGKPLVQPLFYYNDSDSNLYKATDQFMWGDEILVAPVLQKNVSERKLYLPAGKWYNLITDQEFEGGKWKIDNVDLNNIPVYVKEGSFIPMFNDSTALNTISYSGKKITVAYYPSFSKTSYTLYDDDGFTNNTLPKGNYELIKFTGKTVGKTITISITKGKKKLKDRELQIRLPATTQITSLKINGMQSDKFSKNKLQLSYKGKPVTIIIQVN